MNGSYGAFANEFFLLSNSVIANSITAQGRDVIKYMYQKIEEYFYKEWFQDEDAHGLLGIEFIAKKDDKYFFLNKFFQYVDGPFTSIGTGDKGDILKSRNINLKSLIPINKPKNEYEILYRYAIFIVTGKQIGRAHV